MSGVIFDKLSDFADEGLGSFRLSCVENLNDTLDADTEHQLKHQIDLIDKEMRRRNKLKEKPFDDKTTLGNIMNQAVHNKPRAYETADKTGSSIQWRIWLDFVHPDAQDGYQRQFATHECTRDEAIVRAITAHINEKYPLAGISVYACVLVI